MSMVTSFPGSGTPETGSSEPNNLFISTRRWANVIQIRMTERELELKWVPVSFFVKKIAEKG
jgi:hypothetical protein